MDVSTLHLLLVTFAAWLDRREREMFAYLIEENRLLRRQLGRQRLHLTDADRRRLAALAHRLGRHALREVATIATPDTLLRWHRQLIAQKWTYHKTGARRRGVHARVEAAVANTVASTRGAQRVLRSGVAALNGYPGGPFR